MFSIYMHAWGCIISKLPLLSDISVDKIVSAYKYTSNGNVLNVTLLQLCHCVYYGSFKLSCIIYIQNEIFSNTRLKLCGIFVESGASVF